MYTSQGNTGGNQQVEKVAQFCISRLGFSADETLPGLFNYEDTENPGSKVGIALLTKKLIQLITIYACVKDTSRLTRIILYLQASR